MKHLFENFRRFLDEDVGGFTAEFQLFIPRSCPDEKCDPAKLGRTDPITNTAWLNKPRGGLWTSTASEAENDTWTSEWNEWMKTDMPQWMNAQGVLLKPKTSNVFHVETPEDADMLYKQFPYKPTGAMAAMTSMAAFGIGGDKNIDFEAALREYDAIHWGTKGGGDSDAWNFGSAGSWDVESTVWRDISVLEVVEVVPVSIVDAMRRS